jgi:hypothetical protein
VMNGYVRLNFRGGAKPNLSGSNTVLGHATIFPCRARLNSLAGKSEFRVRLNFRGLPSRFFEENKVSVMGLSFCGRNCSIV